MTNLMDKLQRELEELGRNAQDAIEEGKTRVRLIRLERQRDNAARDLGILVHRRERGGEVDPRRVESLLLRIDDLEAEIVRVRAAEPAAEEQAAPAPEPDPSATEPPPPPAE